MPGTGSTSAISITISTPRGPVRGQWRPASITRAAAILLPDTVDTQTGSFRLFDDLAARIQRAGVCALQLEHSAEGVDGFEDRLIRLLSALTALRRQGVERAALIGWRQGAAMAIAAGSASDTVTGVAALAADPSTAELVSEVAPRRLLLMHGTADTVVSPAVSRLLYARAGDPKELVIYPGERHDFSVYHDEALDKLSAWTNSLLRSPFKPRASRQRAVAAAPHVTTPAHETDTTLTAPGLR